MSVQHLLSVAGHRVSGQNVRTQNGNNLLTVAHCVFLKLIFGFSPVMAASAIANVVKSSLGPIGLDKMLVDDIGVSKHRGYKHWLLSLTALCVDFRM